MFLTDLFKAAKNLFTRDSVETAQSLLTQLCQTDITAEKAGALIDKVVTLVTAFLASDEKVELLRYLDDLRFAADLNKEEVQAAVNTVMSLYNKLDTAAKAEVTNKKETNMPTDVSPVAAPVTEPVKDAVPAAVPVTDAATVPAAEPTKDYSPGATGVAGPGAQKMVEDGGFISELKALIAKYEGTQDSKPFEGKETPAEEAKEKKVEEQKEATRDSVVSVVAPAEVVVQPAVTATLDSSSAGSKGIDEFLADLRK